MTITSPTALDTYTASSNNLDIDGTASDDTGVVTQVTWSNDRGGSGTAVGTINWSVSGIVLQSGDNVITVTARDAANNSSHQIFWLWHILLLTLTHPVYGEQSVSWLTVQPALSLSSGLSWAAGVNAASHGVYFGTDYNSVLNADNSSPEYKENQTSDYL